jgi:TldD protein
MEKIISRLEDRLNRLDAEYSDFRYVEVEKIRIRTKDGKLEEVKESYSCGIGFRVLKGGAFGFSATGNLDEKFLGAHLEQAYRMAKRFSKIRHTEVKLTPLQPVRDRWEMPVDRDPWKISLKEKTDPLFEAEKILKGFAWVDSASSVLDFTRKKITFVSSEGRRIEQTLYRTGGWLSAESWIETRAGRGGSKREKIRRSWPGPSGVFRAQGYEAIQAFDFPKEARRLGEELKELRESPDTPTGVFDLILKGSILALQIHETFGHASESDRVYGYEDNFGGRTFLNPGLMGGYPVASKEVTLVSDAGMNLGPGAGSFLYDDEGVKHQKTEIVRKGNFIDYLTSRETAFFLNRPTSSANMVALDWTHYPIIRMTNTNLLPGRFSLDEMIRTTEKGFLLDNESSWSIDEMRLGFQIGAECGYRINQGKIQGLVRFPAYHGNTLDFWRSCDAVAGEKEWQFWGFADCGKGGPYQEAFTGHGLSPARFRNVHFGRD